MAAVCPYQAALAAVPRQPAVLVTVAADDGRVPAWGPAKWVAALSAGRQQEAERQPTAGGSAGHSGGTSGDSRVNCQAAPALLLPRQAGGHFGAEREHVADRALEYAFLVATCEEGSNTSSLGSGFPAVAAAAEQ
jgi:protease II